MLKIYGDGVEVNLENIQYPPPTNNNNGMQPPHSNNVTYN